MTIPAQFPPAEHSSVSAVSDVSLAQARRDLLSVLRAFAELRWPSLPARFVVKTLQVTGFRCFREVVTLRCGLLTLVIGKNNTGKSNLLEVFRLCTPRSLRAFLLESKTTHGSHSSIVSGGLDFVFPSSILGADGDLANPYRPPSVRAGFVIGRVVLGLALERRDHLLFVEWFRDQRRICTLVVSANLAKAKFIWSSDPVHQVDGRSLTKSFTSKAIDVEFTRLQALLAGSARIAYHRSSQDDRALIDALEVRLSTELPEGRAQQFLDEVSRFFGIPTIQLLKTSVTNRIITPTPRQQREEASDFAELGQLRDVLRRATRTGRRRQIIAQVLRFVDELAASRDPARKSADRVGSGGLLLKDDWSMAKNLGSGFRSILLLCLEIELNDVILIDEPESFLHPALQSLLVSYILNRAVRDHKQIIIATHSEVFLDAFYRMPNHTIVVETTTSAQGVRVSAIRGRGVSAILDDLGVRASHILQANAVIWVEGPSDRILIRRWLDLWSGGRLREGVHYQCVCYGGRLLSHYSGGPGDRFGADRIEMLKINRHAIVVLDSDKRDPVDVLNETKLRVIREVSSDGGIAWVTMGRTIENYIPARILELVGLHNCRLEAYDSIDDLLSTSRTALGKVELARRAASATGRPDIEGNLDLEARLEEVSARIELWNGIRDAHGSSTR